MPKMIQVSANFAPYTIWTGDNNLYIMRGMNSETVDLIYLDPPFNSKADYAAPIGSKAAGAAFTDQAHVNGMESFWATMKRGYYGTFHRMSPKHLGRYVDEFSGRHNIRESDTIDQMEAVARGLLGKLLRYRDLIKPNGRPSGARAIA